MKERDLDFLENSEVKAFEPTTFVPTQLELKNALQDIQQLEEELNHSKEKVESLKKIEEKITDKEIDALIDQQRKKTKESEIKRILKPINAIAETNKLGAGILKALKYFAVFTAEVGEQFIKPIGLGISGLAAIWGIIRAAVDESRHGRKAEAGAYGLRLGAAIATGILIGLAIGGPVTGGLLIVTSLVSGLFKDSYLVHIARDAVAKHKEVINEAKQNLDTYNNLWLEAKKKLSALNKNHENPEFIKQQELVNKYKNLIVLQEKLLDEHNKKLKDLQFDRTKEKTRVALTTMSTVGAMITVAGIFVPPLAFVGIAIMGLSAIVGAIEKSGGNRVSRLFNKIGNYFKERSEKPAAKKLEEENELKPELTSSKAPVEIELSNSSTPKLSTSLTMMGLNIGEIKPVELETSLSHTNKNIAQPLDNPNPQPKIEETQESENRLKIF